MDLETQGRYIDIIYQDFNGMKNMLDHIRDNITKYPVFTQLEFIKPLKSIIFESLQDSLDDSNEFLNNYDGGDTVEVSGK